MREPIPKTTAYSDMQDAGLHEEILGHLSVCQTVDMVKLHLLVGYSTPVALLQEGGCRL